MCKVSNKKREYKRQTKKGRRRNIKLCEIAAHHIVHHTATRSSAALVENAYAIGLHKCRKACRELTRRKRGEVTRCTTMYEAIAETHTQHIVNPAGKYKHGGLVGEGVLHTVYVIKGEKRKIISVARCAEERKQRFQLLYHI